MGHIKTQHIITDNSSERISVITDETTASLKQEFKGQLPEEIPAYKIIILNRQEAEYFVAILRNWLRIGG